MSSGYLNLRLNQKESDLIDKASKEARIPKSTFAKNIIYDYLEGKLSSIKQRDRRLQNEIRLGMIKLCQIGCSLKEDTSHSCVDTIDRVLTKKTNTHKIENGLDEMAILGRKQREKVALEIIEEVNMVCKVPDLIVSHIKLMLMTFYATITDTRVFEPSNVVSEFENKLKVLFENQKTQ